MFSRTAFATVLFCCVSPLAVPRMASPPRGPGAVLEAVRGVLGAADRGDRAYLARAFAPMAAQEGVEFAVGADGAVELSDNPSSLEFLDVGADDRIVTARDPKGAIAALLQAEPGTKVAHRLVSARANCPGEQCSWATVKVERTIERGGKSVVVPLRITVLARFVAEEPHMRIFVWHASRGD